MRTAVCLPGFADTSRYWSGQVPDWLDVATLDVEWPGTWDNEHVDDPVSIAIARAVGAVRSGDVVIGHSMGARAALEVANASRPAALILLAPPPPTPAFLTPSAVRQWRTSGVRPTMRPDPLTGRDTELLIDVTYADSWLRRPSSLATVVPTLAFLFSDDAAAPPTLLDATTIIELEGPHRWWESPAASRRVAIEAHEWLVDTLS